MTTEKVPILDTLTSLFYDLAKAVPVGKLNQALINTVVRDIFGQPVRVNYTDELLRRWAAAYARQLIDFETNFSSDALVAMGSKDERLCYQNKED